MTTESPPTTPTTVKRGFATGYAAGALPDEMVEADGSLRPHWRSFVSQLDDIGHEELPRRWEQARRLIRENGITYNVYGDPNGLDRPWNLDMIPLLIPESEWNRVATGLSQRARLLDAILADLYGPRRMLSEGLIPAELLYCNRSFLRPLHGVTPPRGKWLHVYSPDIVRQTDGSFAVLSDRTQAPSGGGYTLENRIVLSSALHSVFRQCSVHRLAPYFIAMRRMLASLARNNVENPRIVLLTPGPYNESYFEHSYLARYLGYTLVQGNDLTVRDGRVFLKTLGELQRVDVILRRVDDDFCDPLELYQQSFLGVPGLVEAVRQGNVAIANALGSGAMQAPAFLPFLPALCRRLFQEDLLVPSVQTWWCGEAQSRQYVLDNLSKLVIKPAFPTSRLDVEFGNTLNREQLAELAARIAAHPVDYVAQEHMGSWTAPVLVNDSVQPRRFALRTFLVAENSSYNVMSGGLTRVTSASDSLVVSLQRGGGSKDTWILAESPVNEATLLTSASQTIQLNRGGGDLPSRVADDLFWLGRYMQRAENDVRIARSLFGRLMLPTVRETVGTVDTLAAELLEFPGFTIEEQYVPALVAEVFGTSGGSNIRSAIGHVEDLVRSLRDRVSTDTWRILQSIERDLGTFDANVKDDQLPSVVHLLNRLAVDFLAFDGVLSESMTRGLAWRFLDLGDRIERSLVLIRLLKALFHKQLRDEPTAMEAVLEIADSALTYRRRYFTQLDVTAVLDLLIADDGNPRAVAYQIAAIEQHLAALPRDAGHPMNSPHKQTIMQLRTRLTVIDLKKACELSTKGVREGFAALCDELTEGLETIAELVSQIYFSHAAVTRRLSENTQEAAS